MQTAIRFDPLRLPPETARLRGERRRGRAEGRARGPADPPHGLPPHSPPPTGSSS